jgi:hypothetical protein
VKLFLTNTKWYPALGYVSFFSKKFEFQKLRGKNMRVPPVLADFMGWVEVSGEQAMTKLNKNET